MTGTGPLRMTGTGPLRMTGMGPLRMTGVDDKIREVGQYAV